MKIEKLFRVLVVGGALMAGCGGAPAVPDEVPTEKPAAPAESDEAPASDDADKPATEEDKKEDGKDGICTWF